MSAPFALCLPLIPIVVFGVLGLALLRHDYRVPEDIPYWAFIFGLPHWTCRGFVPLLVLV